MSSSDFFIICGTGFLAVFLLLSILAFLMRLLIILFPEKEKDDAYAPAVAAIAVTFKSLYPGTKITKIERQQ